MSKRVNNGRVRGRLVPAAAAALLVGTATGLAGQDREARESTCTCWGPGVTMFQGLDPIQFRSSRARLGVSLDMRASDKDMEGARVTGVVEDGPAQRAGLREGDVITSIDGHRLLDPLPESEAERRIDLDRSVPAQRLVAVARELEPGAEVRVEYVRGGETRQTTVVAEEVGPMALALGERMEPMLRRLEELPERLHVQPRVFEFRGDSPPGNLELLVDGDRWRLENGLWTGSHGLALMGMNPGLGEYFGTTTGVLVTEVDDDNPLGLRAGDVILSIDGRTVDSPRDVRRILGSYDGDEEMTLRIVRQKAEREVRGTVRRP